MRRKTKLIIGATAAAGALGVGVAYAAWNVGGSGSGSAKAATAENITLNPAVIGGAGDLYPGFTDGDLSFVVVNGNNFPVNISAITTGTITSNTAGCDGTNITVDALTTLNIDVPALSPGTAVTLTDVVSMIADADTECQGATFNVAFTAVTATSDAA